MLPKSHDNAEQHNSNPLKIVSLMAFYNEIRYLEGWFENLRGRVSNIILLDDGSTDNSSEFVKNQPETTLLIQIPPEKKREWNEVENRKKLILAAQQHTQADWFLTIDADERLEDKFWDDLEKIITYANEKNIVAFSFRLREMWDSPLHYRSDGIWGKKTKAAFFRNLGDMHQFDETRWHGEWVPMQVWGTDKCQLLDYNLYHLKMIEKPDRIERYQRYTQLDPNKQYQSIGYDYLVDETNLKLESIYEKSYKGMPYSKTKITNIKY